MILNCGAGEDSWESLGLQGDPTSPFWRRSVLDVHWKDWCCSWNSNTLVTSSKELTYWKRPWCWEGLGVEGEGDDRKWDGWMASLTPWMWVWVNSGRWWWTRETQHAAIHGVTNLDMTERLNWTELNGNVALESFVHSNLSNRYCQHLLDHTEKAMEPNSSTLSWKIPWVESLVGCSPWGC